MVNVIHRKFYGVVGCGTFKCSTMKLDRLQTYSIFNKNCLAQLFTRWRGLYVWHCKRAPGRHKECWWHTPSYICKWTQRGST